ISLFQTYARQADHPTIKAANGPVSQFQHTPKMPVHRKSAISRATNLVSCSIYYDLLSILMGNIWIQGANRLLRGLEDRIQDRRRNRQWKPDMENSLSNFLTIFCK